MAAPLKNLKTSFDKLRRDSVGVASEAQRIVSDGVQRMAEHELKALNDTYNSVLSAVRANRGESLREAAGKHLDLMQETMTKLIGSAKESLGILAETRQELTGLLAPGGSGKPASGRDTVEKELGEVTEQAKKVVAEVKHAASQARDQATKVGSELLQSAEKVLGQARASAGKVTAQAGKVVSTATAEARRVADVVKAEPKAVRNRVGSVLDVKPKAPAPKKPVVASRPSGNSRASLATSKAKQAAGSAVNAARDGAAKVVKAAKNAG